ncbi:MAG: polyribonucleotide nucleotidyltransferase [Patescibacteria group bacterium]|nr:polyribonucleotide nucleotidyltransferase [Patescibacteria group bacterium]
MQFRQKIGEKELEVQIGDLAVQASGSCLIKWGETSLLSTCQLGQELGDLGFFPLTCDYEERYYAAGKILGSRFIRREGRPTAEAILIDRMIDRTLRPLFPKELKREVQVINTCLSWDGENDPAVLGVLGASLSLVLSEIPWQGPVGAVRVGKVGEKFLLNPDYSQREEGELDIVFSAVQREGKILCNMIEGEGEEVKEETIFKAYEFALPYLKELIEFQKEIAKKIGKKKIEIEKKPIDKSLEKEVKKFLEKKLEKALYFTPSQKFGGESRKEKLERQTDLENLKEELLERIEMTFGQDFIREAKNIFEEEKEKVLRENILKKEKRPDGRGLKEIREIEIKVGILPRTHGSGFFSRGLTKILSILTLGAPGDQQLLEGMEISGKKRFIHHYNFPPYSVGEVRKLMAPGRREIGHGMLVERALLPLIPSFEEFPYTIRVVSEALSSNGSTSMASVSAASLALMDAGVPIKRPAAGIAVGLITDPSFQNYKFLTDIQGPEDSHGDMDFKIAGTEKGALVLQMDVKIAGITPEILRESLERAKKARLEILEKMKKVLAQSRTQLSPFAPRVFALNINPEKIGLVIGTGGSVVKRIIETCGVSIDIEDSGRILITSQNNEALKRAIGWIKDITKEIEVGDVFQGKVKKILDFGAIIEILPGKEGLCHISELAPGRLKRVQDHIRIGKILPVKVIKIDELGRIYLSAKQSEMATKYEKSTNIRKIK